MPTEGRRSPDELEPAALMVETSGRLTACSTGWSVLDESLEREPLVAPAHPVEASPAEWTVDAADFFQELGREAMERDAEIGAHYVERLDRSTDES